VKTAIIQFLSFKPRNVTSEIYIAMAIIYGAMIAATLHSILQTDAPPRSKAFWAAVVIILPIVGMAAYCLASLLKADCSFLQTIGLLKKPRQQF